MPIESKRPSCAKEIDEGIRRRVVMYIDYISKDGSKTKRREIEPMVLARTKLTWYLLAWCRLRQAGRWFRLDRIAKVKLTNVVPPRREISGVFGIPPVDAQPVDIDSL